jgi:hypothetical protein
MEKIFMKKNINSNNPFLLPLVGYVFFVSLIQFFTLLLSIIKIQITPLLAGITLITSIILAAGYCIVKIKSNKQEASFNKKTWVDYTAYVFIASIAAVYLLLWFLAIVSPDLSYDGNMYHIPTISIWANSGHVTWSSIQYEEAYINGYPKAAELIAYVMGLALGNATLNSVNLVFFPLGVLGIASLAYSLGTRSSLSLLAGMIFLLVPVNINQASTTYVDSSYASCAIAFSAIWLIIVKEGMGRPIDRAIPLGASIGLVLGTKSTGIALTFVGLFILIIHLGIQLFSKKSMDDQSKKVLWRSVLISLGLAVVMAVLVGGYWFIRNFSHTGTPLYPVGLNIFGKTIFPGNSISETINQADMTPKAISNLPGIFKIFYSWLQDPPQWPSSIKGYDTRLGGLGFLWVLGCLPAIIYFFIHGLKMHNLISSGYLHLLVFITTAFILTPLNWWSRYTIWIYALGLPTFAWIMGIISSNHFMNRTMSLLSKCWLLICIMVAFIEGMICTVDAVALATPGSFSGSPFAFFQPSTWNWPASYLFPEMRGTALERILVSGKIVAIGPHGNSNFGTYSGLVGELSQPIAKRRLIFLGEDTTIKEIQSLSIDNLIWDISVSLPHSLSTFPKEQVFDFIVISFP